MMNNLLRAQGGDTKKGLLKLYYAAGASSLASHILLRISALPFELVRVDLSTHRVLCVDYRDVNPKGYVPALQLASGEILTEGMVILQFIADQVPRMRLLPPQGSYDRYRALSWLSFIATEVHKNFISPDRHGGISANFLANSPEGQRQTAVHVMPRLQYLERSLTSRMYLMGDKFTAPDAYLFTMLTWAGRLSISMDDLPRLRDYMRRIYEIPEVEEALQTEGAPHSLSVKS